MLDTWGTTYPGAHGLTLAAENGEDFLFISDCARGNKLHQAGSVIKTTTGGRELMKIDHPSKYGAYKEDEIFSPTETAIAANGDIVFADAGNHSVRRVTTQGVVSTIAGTGTTGDVNGEGDIAQFASPLDVAVDSQGNIFVVDFGNQKIKRIDTDGMVTTYAGTGEIGFMDGIPSIATFNNPRNLFIDENDVIYVGTDDAIRLITPEF